MVVVELHWINFRSVLIFADFKIREIHENMYSANIYTFTVVGTGPVDTGSAFSQGNGFCDLAGSIVVP